MFLTAEKESEGLVGRRRQSINCVFRVQTRSEPHAVPTTIKFSNFRSQKNLVLTQLQNKDPNSAKKKTGSVSGWNRIHNTTISMVYQRICNSKLRIKNSIKKGTSAEPASASSRRSV